jgi:metal-responsive CopG/Arc/MetJ family transcriptional regulator
MVISMSTGYSVIKIPDELAEEIDKIVGKHGYRSRTEFVKDAVRTLLREYAREVAAESKQ